MSERLTVALTLDDAPSIAAEGPLAFDPARMDRVREALQAARVERCVAFVIGSHARGHEAPLARWLEAGYELGNHTDDHAFASRTDFAGYVASIRRCDALLQSLGAFDGGRPRYFRFPYGDRGRSPSARAALLAACEELGYQPAEVSIYVHDHCYELPLARALGAAAARVRAVEQRCVATAVAAFASAARRGRRLFGERHGHVAALHFGLVAERTLPELLARLAPSVHLVDLGHALASPAYTRYASDLAANGIIAGRLTGRAERALGRFARWSERAGWFGQARLGPRWPHLYG